MYIKRGPDSIANGKRDDDTAFVPSLPLSLSLYHGHGLLGTASVLPLLLLPRRLRPCSSDPLPLCGLAFGDIIAAAWGVVEGTPPEVRLSRGAERRISRREWRPALCALLLLRAFRPVAKRCRVVRERDGYLAIVSAEILRRKEGKVARAQRIEKIENRGQRDVWKKEKMKKEQKKEWEA
ncbi:hypothetical protein NL676_033474 [Syzygium grande]|nr:hypothetical protein NL676_033474 [Syzygium grande]